MLRSLVSLMTLATTLIAVHAQGQTPDARAKQPAASRKPAVMVNLNTASATELAQLPGIGPKAAARIIEYRQQKGPFKKVEDLMNVKGIGEKSFLKLKPEITISGAPAAAATAARAPQD